MPEAPPTPCLFVLAGTNGAGKSSLLGALLDQAGVEYFNPDTAACQIRQANPGLRPAEANSAAWKEGVRLLAAALRDRLTFALETTLGGTTIAGMLEQALAEGIEVRMWYVGLSSPELHIARVRARVQQGGHDIPEERIRERYTKSRLNLIRLLPRLTELRVYDNSADADPAANKAPRPVLLLHWVHGHVERTGDLPRTPEWAKPILAAAFAATGTAMPSAQ